MKRTIAATASTILVAGSLIAVSPDAMAPQEQAAPVVQEEMGFFERLKGFFVDAFADMKENTIAQYQVDKANFQAVKMEAKAQWEEAKAGTLLQRNSNVKTNPAVQLQQSRAQQLEEANRRIMAAQERIDAAKN